MMVFLFVVGGLIVIIRLLVLMDRPWSCSSDTMEGKEKTGLYGLPVLEVCQEKFQVWANPGPLIELISI